MQKLINAIVRHRRFVLAGFVVLMIASAIMLTQVKVNYNIQDYLPKDQPSVVAVTKLKEEYNLGIPNARVVLPVSSYREGLEMKQKLKETKGVEQVMWLDDVLPEGVPLAMADKATADAMYTGTEALYQVKADTNDALSVLKHIYALSDGCKVSGQLVDLANAQSSVESEMFTIALLLIPIVLTILMISTHAWLEPLVFLAAIGVGILLNSGTNMFLGEISFITQAVGAVIQLAVSMDYAVFLLNRFNEYRLAGNDPEKAMALAMRKAVTAVASSALTTLFGFMVLLFMRFRIGADLGIVMAKGIFFSFFSVMVFMPCFLLRIYKLMDKTIHRSLLPDFSFIGRMVMRGRWILVIFALLLMLPTHMAKSKNHFIYGMGAYPRGSRSAEDRSYIVDHFGDQQQISLMVPKGNIRNEQKLQEELNNMPDVVSAISYVEKADPAIPLAVMDKDQISQLVSKNYTQFIITAAVPAEGDRAFNLAKELRAVAGNLYGDKYYMTGQNIVMLDMKNTIQADDVIVNGLAILTIAVVIGLAFKSLTLPIILVSTIELAIWMNLSVPYFLGNKLSYIGYLIISTVQLGATVDYAIFYTEHYLDNRKIMNKKQAVIQSSRESIPSIFPPAMILTAAGVGLYVTSSLAMVSELGEVLGRGAVLSFLLVVLVLPGALYFLDKIVEKTTWKLKLAPPKAPDIELRDLERKGEGKKP